MRYTADHKRQTRAKILRAAGRVFRRRGYHASGVDKVMEEAGLTAGGFYAHFDSKEALLAETLASAAAEAGSTALGEDECGGTAGLERAEAFIDRYLSWSHLRQQDDGCPLPALVSEIARAGGPAKASFEAIVRDLASRLRDRTGGDHSEDHALAIVALCVGGIAVARSVRDEGLGERILASCGALARAGLGAEADPDAPRTTTRNRKKN